MFERSYGDTAMFGIIESFTGLKKKKNNNNIADKKKKKNNNN